MRIITAVSVGKERAQRELEKGKELWELAENLRKSANEELIQAREAVEQMFLDGQQVQELLGLESSPVPRIPEGSSTFEEHWDEVAEAEAVDRTFPEEQEVQEHPELPSSPVAEPPPQPSTDDEPHHSVTGAEWSDPNAADRTSFQDIGPFPVPESKPVPTANGKSHEFTSESSKLGEVAGGKGRGSGRNFVKASSELVREVAARGLDRAVSFPKEWEPKSEGRLSDRLGIPEVDGRLRGLDTDFRGTGYHLTPSGNGTPGDGEVIKKELSDLRRSLETIRSSSEVTPVLGSSMESPGSGESTLPPHNDHAFPQPSTGVNEWSPSGLVSPNESPAGRDDGVPTGAMPSLDLNGESDTASRTPEEISEQGYAGLTEMGGLIQEWVRDHGSIA